LIDVVAYAHKNNVHHGSISDKSIVFT